MLTFSPLPRILIFGLLATLGGGFFIFNWIKLDELRRLDHHGITAVGTVDAVHISHQACASTISVAYVGQRSWFQVCGANRSVGDRVSVVYLPETRGTAMLARSEDSFGDSHYVTGCWIGAMVALLGFAMLVASLAKACFGTRPGRRRLVSELFENDRGPTSPRDVLVRANTLRAAKPRERD